MVEEKEVSVGWQMVLTFIPILDLWAYYRIKKFWLGVVANLVVGFLVGIPVGVAEELAGVPFDEFSIEGTIAAWVISSLVIALFVIRRWSISWNEKVTYQHRVF